MYKRNCSPSAYLEQWQNSWLSLSENSGRPPNYTEKMSTTWQVSYNKMQRDNPTAAELLKYFGCLDNQNLDYEILQDRKTQFKAPARLSSMVSNKSVFLEAIGSLMDSSFITCTVGDRWTLHSVLHKWVRCTFNEPMNVEYLRWAVICVGSRAEKRGSTRYWDKSRRLGAHAVQCMNLLGSVPISVGSESWESWCDRLLGLSRLCIARGQELEKAEKILQCVVTGKGMDCMIGGASRPPRDTHASIRARTTLGNLHRIRGAYTKAAVLYEESILILQNSDRWKEAWLERSLQDILENLVDLLPSAQLQNGILKDPRLTLRTKERLRALIEIKEANSLLENKDFKNALIIFDALLKRTTLKPDDKQSIRIWKDAALCHAKEEDYGRAGDLFAQVLTCAKQLKRGCEESLTLDILNNYGIVCQKRGQLEKAEVLFSDAEKGLRPRRGMADGLYLNAAENLGHLLLQRGARIRAQEMFLACLNETAALSKERATRITNRISSIHYHENRTNNMLALQQHNH